MIKIAFSFSVTLEPACKPSKKPRPTFFQFWLTLVFHLGWKFSLSSLTKEDLRQIKSYEKDDILTQSAKNVKSFQERTMGPEDVELTDNENSSEEKYSCDEDNNIDR